MLKGFLHYALQGIDERLKGSPAIAFKLKGAGAGGGGTNFSNSLGSHLPAITVLQLFQTLTALIK